LFTDMEISSSECIESGLSFWTQLE
jgi:hypothetical protein